jgi:hypothetical protein
MSPAKRPARWTLKDRKTRMLIYLLVLLVIATWRFAPRPWHPTVTLRTAHHLIYSTATREETEEMAQALELLYGAYSNRLGGLARFQPQHPELKVKLFKDRAEFRWVNPGLGWAEAFYRKPYCRAYFSAQEINPYHWMLHESVHQLNAEVARLALEKWLEEGLADYFSCSVLASNELAVGRIDPNTYPVWWIDEIATTPDLAENIRNGSVIPLRSIITNRGGPSLNSHFNLYYLHWWTLAHYLFESPRLRERLPALVERGGGLESFEELIGPVDPVQTDWHTYVRSLKRTLAGNDLDARRAGRPLPGNPSGLTP